MNRCFIIQPFDGGPFDKRFDDVLAPAVQSAKLEPYRVDRDPSVTVLIDSIENGIREAAACLVDISSDNPNVWFELGYALALEKPVVLICSSQRHSRFPFDIQHRPVIKYDTESPSDFDQLRTSIAERLGAAMSKESRVQSLAATPLRDTEGLESHEIAALVLIAETDLEGDSAPSAQSLKSDMARVGYTDLATVLAVKALRAKKLVTAVEVQTYNGDGYVGYQLLDGGTKWLMTNRNRLMLRKDQKPAKKAADEFEDFPTSLDDDDDLPF